MTEEQRHRPGFWADLRRHPSFQAAIVFGGGSWLAVQAADVFGMDTRLLRWLGVGIVLVLVALVAGACVGVLRRSDAAAVRWRSLKPRTVGVAAASLLLLGTGAWVARPFVFGSVRPGADVIAVLPFEVSGPGVELLGEGLVDLLSTNLDEVGPIRTVNPRTLLHHYRQQAQGGGLDVAGALRVGRAVGAGSVVIGSVVAVGGEVRVRAELHAVDGDRVLARAQKSGSAENVLGLVDELSIELMRDIWRAREPLPELRVSAITTPSVPAIRAYLRGEQFYRRVHWDSAAVAFEEAIAHDSTFALAHFRLGETYGWREALGSDQARRHSDAAARFADRLPARERALVVAHRLHEFGDVAAVDSFRSYTARYPDDIAGWYMLADARFHAAAVTGTDLATLTDGFERVHRMDPTYAQAYAHMLEIAFMVSDSARYDELLRSFGDVAPEEVGVYAAARQVRWGARSDALAAIDRAIVDGGARGTILNRIGAAAAIRTYSERPDPAFLPEALDVVERHAPPAAHPGLQVTRASALAGAGRLREADRALEPVRGTEYAFGAALPFVVGHIGPADVFADERARLRNAPPRRGAAYWRAVQALAREDAAAAAAEIRTMRGDTTSAPPLPDAMIDALEAWARVVRGDTVAGTAALRDAVIRSGYSPGIASFTAPLRQQLAILQSLRPDTRAEGLRRLELMAIMEPQTLPFIHVHLARSLEAEGRSEHAAAVYARFAALWAGADPELQDMVRSAQLAVRRLTGREAGPT